MLTAARKSIANNDFVEAIQKLNICLDIQPQNPEVLFFRGACKYSLYDNLGAEQDLTAALQQYSPYYYDALHYRSQVRYRLSDFPGASEDLDKIIEKQGSNSRLYLERAYVRLARNDFASALEDCRKAIALGAVGEEIYLCKAAAEDALENYHEAIADYDKAIKINAGNANNYVRRGITRNNAGDVDGAMEDYYKALSIDTACTLAYFSRAEAEAKMDSTRAALRDYNTVLKYEPRNAYAYFNRGVLYTNTGKYKLAIADYDKVLLLNPDNVQALSNRARLKQETKDLKGALKDYSTIIELYPYFMEAYYNRARVKASMGDAKGAKKDMETGKLMSELFHSKSNRQLSNDSTLVANLLHLSGDFGRTEMSGADSLAVRFQPFFYIAELHGNERNGYPAVALLNKLNRRTNRTFCFANKELYPADAAPGFAAMTDSGWTKIILSSNKFLLHDASAELSRVMNQDTSDPLAWFQQAMIRCRESEILEMTAQPGMLMDSSHQANASRVQEKQVAAMNDLTRALQLNPSFSFAWFNRGNLKCMLRDFNEALKDYESALKTNPDFAEAHYNMGFVLFYMNYGNEACQEFSKAGELGFPPAYAFIRKYCGDSSK